MLRLLATLLLALTSARAGAEELRVLSAGAVEPGLVAVARDFERESGHTVRIEVGTAPQLTAKLAAGLLADVFIAPPAVMDTETARKATVPSSRVPVGRVGVGVVVRRGARVPDVTSPEALRAEVGRARTVVYNRASTGQYVDGMLGRLGLTQDLASKTVRVDAGEEVMRRLATGTGDELGFAAIPEIRMLEPEGVQLVAPLPATLQNYTAYYGAVTATATARAAADAFVRFLATPRARERFAAAGIEPLP